MSTASIRILFVTAGLTASCSTLSAPAAFEGPMVIPCDEESHYVFGRGEATLHSKGGRRESFPLPELNGRPACVAWDFAEGYGVAAYADGLARITLDEGEAPEVLGGEPWARTPASITMAGGLMAVIGGTGSSTSLEMRNVESGARLWGSKLGSWMDSSNLDKVAFVLPTEPYDGDHFLIVASSGRRIVVQRVDRSIRPWAEEARTEFGELHRLQAWTSDGEDVFLAGVHERATPPSHGSMGTLKQTLLVYRFDAQTLTKHELLRREGDTISTVVSNLSIASNLAVMTLNGKRVEVYRLENDVMSQPAIDRQRFPHTVHGLCTTADSIVISGGDQPVYRTYER